MSRRSRKRQAGVKKSWVGRAAAIVLGLALFAVVIGYISLRSYLHGESFRKFLSGKVSQPVGVKGEFSPFNWEGLALETDGYTAEGSGRLKSIKAEGLHTEVSFDGVGRGVWEIKNTVLNRLDVSIDTQAQEPTPDEKADTPAVKRAKKSPLLPNEVEFMDMDLRNVSVRVLSSGGLAAATGLRVKAENAGGKDSYRAEVTGGEISLPWKHVPVMTLDSTKLRYQDGLIFISDAQLSAKDGGRIQAGGEWDTKEKTMALDGSMDGFRCESTLTGDWARRLSGDVSSTFSLQGKDGDISTKGRLEVRNGVLTALPILDVLAAYADTRRFRVLNLSEAHTDWQWTKGELRLTNLVIASEGLIRVEGSLTVRDGKLDGQFMLGLAPGVLASIPGAEEDVFLPGERSLLWTPLRVTGTVKDPKEDLTDRLIAAAGARMFEIIPETGAKALKFGQTILKEVPPETIEKGVEKGEKLIREGEKTIRGVSDALNGILGD